MKTPQIRLTNPSEVVASIPHLMGFTPEESILVLWLRDGSLLVLQRFDIPPTLPESAVAEFQAEAFGHSAAASSDDAIPVIITANPGAAADRIAATLLKGAFSEEITAKILITDMSKVRMYGHDEYRPVIDHDSPLAVSGVRPVSSRTVLEQEFRGDREISADLMDAASAEFTALPDDDRAAWMNAVLDQAGQAVLAGDTLSDEYAAQLLTAWGDVNARDQFIGDLANCDATPVSELARLTRLSPHSVKATCATIAAYAAYLSGDGVRANIALSVALEADEHYTLAKYLDVAIAGAINPAQLREMLQQASAAVAA